jgi:hypothetical protein
VGVKVRDKTGEYIGIRQPEGRAALRLYHRGPEGQQHPAGKTPPPQEHRHRRWPRRSATATAPHGRHLHGFKFMRRSWRSPSATALQYSWHMRSYGYMVATMSGTRRRHRQQAHRRDGLPLFRTGHDPADAMERLYEKKRTTLRGR